MYGPFSYYSTSSLTSALAVILIGVKIGQVQGLSIAGYLVPDQVLGKYTHTLTYRLTLQISAQTHVPKQQGCTILVPLSLVSALREVIPQSSNA